MSSQDSGTLINDEFWAEVDSIPWDRLVHCFGRATLVPSLLKQVVEGEREAAISSIKELASIEHQDGVIQATPLVCRFLARILEAQATAASDAIVDLLATCFQAAQTIEPDPRQGPVPPFCWLYSEAELWPPFVSDDDDWIFWEDTSRSTSLHAVAWSQHTLSEISAQPHTFAAVLKEIERRTSKPILIRPVSDVAPLSAEQEAALIAFHGSGASLIDCIKWVRQHHECTLGGAYWLVTRLFSS